MSTYNTDIKGKPFLKWAGGKTQLLHTIDQFLPKSLRNEKEVTYIEPFVGGGAVLFYMLQQYPNIKRAVINDINPHLINTYRVIRDAPMSLIEILSSIQADYRLIKNYDEQKAFYLDIRQRFNSTSMSMEEDAANMIFLNRTCFNGLYRENSKGGFNVPFGRYINPTICDNSLILTDSKLLQKVEIIQGDFSYTKEYIDGYTFFYFDPPYRPLDATSNFNSYVKEAFNDDEQRRLKDYFVLITSNECKALLSNSDGHSRDVNNIFFDDLYKDFIIERVYAKRCINANPSKRGVLTELLIRNYKECQNTDNNLF